MSVASRAGPEASPKPFRYPIRKTTTPLLGTAMPRFTIRGLMIAVVALAMLLADPRLGALLLILTGAVAAFVTRKRSRWAVPYVVTLACVYLPYSWLVLMDYPWNSYRWTWIALWPILPGLPAGMFFHPNDAVEFFVAGVAALALVLLFTRLGAMGRRSLIAASVVALLLEAEASFVAYQLFRA